MDKPTHYVEVRILPLDGDKLSGGDVALVTTKVMTAIHLHIVEGHQVAVSFPNLRVTPLKDPRGNVSEPMGTGNIIRVFGDAMSLMSLLVRQDFAFLIGAAACSVGKQAIREVPPVSTWEIYERDRRTERETPAYVERSGQRLLGRIASGRSPGRTASDVRERADKLAEKSATRLPPYVHIASSSTGQQFRIFLRREASEEFRSAPVSTYGLGVPVPSF